MDAHDRQTDATIHRVSRAAVVVVGAAMIVVPYACGRAYRRWLTRNDPFEALNARIERVVTRYRDRTEIARAFGDLGRGVITGRGA